MTGISEGAITGWGADFALCATSLHNEMHKMRLASNPLIVCTYDILCINKALT